MDPPLFFFFVQIKQTFPIIAIKPISWRGHARSRSDGLDTGPNVCVEQTEPGGSARHNIRAPSLWTDISQLIVTRFLYPEMLD